MSFPAVDGKKICIVCLVLGFTWNKKNTKLSLHGFETGIKKFLTSEKKFNLPQLFPFISWNMICIKSTELWFE